MTKTTRPKHKTKGFASMDPQRQREIASIAGKTAHLNGTAHVFTSEEAREAGRKGALARWAKIKGAA
jgi:uncharacterized protein